MRRLLMILLFIPILAYATDLDMSTLRCRDVHLDSDTTLAVVQHECLIRSQSSTDGMFEVDFRNDATGQVVSCYFGSNSPSAYLDGCK